MTVAFPLLALAISGVCSPCGTDNEVDTCSQVQEQITKVLVDCYWNWT